VLLLEDWAAGGIGSCPLHSRNIGGGTADQKASGAYQAFDENENLKDESQQAAIMQLGSKLATVTAKLNNLTHHRDAQNSVMRSLTKSFDSKQFSIDPPLS